jgi:hypothetical protein
VAPVLAAVYHSAVGNSPSRRLDDSPIRHQVAAVLPLPADCPAVAEELSDGLDDLGMAKSEPVVHPAQSAAARSDSLESLDLDSDTAADRLGRSDGRDKREVAAKFVEGNRWAVKRLEAILQVRSDARDILAQAKCLAEIHRVQLDALDRRGVAAKFPEAVLPVQWGERDSRVQAKYLLVVRRALDLRRLQGRYRSIRR